MRKNGVGLLNTKTMKKIINIRGWGKRKAIEKERIQMEKKTVKAEYDEKRVSDPKSTQGGYEVGRNNLGRL